MNCSRTAIEGKFSRHILLGALPFLVLASCSKSDSLSGIESAFSAADPGNQVTAASLVLSPPSLDFGMVSLDAASAGQKIVLYNRSKQPIYLGPPTTAPIHAGGNPTAGADKQFELFESTCPGTGSPLKASESCTHTFRVIPLGTIPQAIAAEFSQPFGASSGATNLRSAIKLSAELVTAEAPSGNAALGFNPSVIEFARTAVGETASKTLVLSNTSNIPVTLVSLSGLEAPFQITGHDCPLAPKTFGPGETCNLTLGYSPTAFGSSVAYLNASYSISENAAGAALSASMGVTGSSITIGNSAIRFAPSTIDFGAARVTSGSETRSVTLKNTSGTKVYIKALSGFDASFGNLGTNCPMGSAAFNNNAECDISIRFVPQSPGPLAANVTVAYDITAGESGYLSTLGLSGSGVGELSFGGVTSVGPESQITTTQAKVNWTAATGGTVSRYDVFRMVDGLKVYITYVPGNQTSYTESGLTPATLYTYWVKASDALGVPDSNATQVSTTTDPLGTFTGFSMGALAEGQSTASSDLSCVNNHVETPLPQPSFSVLSQSDAAVNCSIIGAGPYQLSCTPEYKAGHADWASDVIVRCTLNGSTLDQTLSLNVHDTNRPPSLAALPDRAVLAEAAMTAVDAADGGDDEDVDGDALTYACRFDTNVDGSVGSGADCATLPSNSVAFNPATGQLSWTPNVAAAGSGSAPYEIAITASDGRPTPLTDSKVFVVTVNGTIVSSVTSSAANGTYRIGDTVPVSVVFSGNVTVSGSPALTLAAGTGASAAYASGSGSNTLVFNYTVLSGHAAGDLDYANAAALALNGGSINDLNGNAAVLGLPAPGSTGSLGANKAIVVDGLRPAVTGVSSSANDGSYAPGTSLSIQVVFSEDVTVIGGTPSLTLETGAVDGNAVFASASGATLNFTYTVQSGDTSADLNYVSTGALALGGATIRDAAGNDASLTLPSLGGTDSLAGNKAIVIDGVSPTITSVTSNKADSSYGASALIDVRVHFSEAVTASGSPRILLETGATDRYALYSSGSGTTTLIFNYTVQAGDSSADLDYKANNSLELNGGTISDLVGNSALLTLAAPGAAGSFGANSAIVVDTSSPAVSGVTSSTANGSYKAGQSISIQATFSEPVSVSGSPVLAMSTGGSAAFSSVAGAVVTFSYLVQAGETSADLDYGSTSALSGGAITDIAGNPAVLTLAVPGAANSLGANKAIVIDTTAPNAPVIGSPTTGSYSTVPTFTLSGTCESGATITLKDGATTVTSVAATGTNWSVSLSTALAEGAHSFTAIANDAANNASNASTAVVVTVDTIAPNAPVISSLTSPTSNAHPTISGTGEAGATIKVYVDGSTLVGTTTANGSGGWSLSPSGALTSASYTVTATATDAAMQVSAASSGVPLVVDTSGPSVIGVTSSTANGSYSAGQLVSIQIGFSENVSVTGTPRIQLNCGPSSPWADYTGGTGTNTLTFQFTTAAGQQTADLDYLAATSLSANGSSLTDSAGNSATLTLPAPAAAGSLGANKSIVIDSVAPTVSSVSSSTADGSYGTGNSIDVRVTFSEAVTVAGGTPTLTLGTAPNRAANYASGSGSSTLVFNYTVQSGDVSTDLDFASTTALSAAGATITDSFGNSATLTLPSPGASGSLGANKALAIVGNNNTPTLAASTASQSVTATIAMTPVNVSDSNTSADTDQDGDAITYACKFDTTANGGMDAGGTSCASLPSDSYSFNASTGVLAWTPNASAATSSNVTYEFQVTGTDSAHLSAAAYFTVTVQPALILTTVANRSFAEGTVAVAGSAMTPVDLNNSVTNDDAGVSYSCVYDSVVDGAVSPGTSCANLAGTAAFDTSTGILTWTPSENAVGTYEVKVSGTKVASHSRVFVLQVRSAIVTAGLQTFYDAIFADAQAAPGSNVPGTSTWENLTSTASSDGSLSNFSYTNSSGWGGDGTATASSGSTGPYRLIFDAANGDSVDFGSAAASNTSVAIDAWVRPSDVTSRGQVILTNGMTTSTGTSSESNSGMKLEQSMTGDGTVELHLGERSYAKEILSHASLTGYWRLGELTGTSARDAKGSLTGTYTNGVTLGASHSGWGDSDKAASFDGVDDYVELPDAFNSIKGTDAWTVDMWLNPSANSFGNNPVIFTASDLGAADLFFEFDTSGGFYWAVGGTYRQYTANPLTPGTWYHVAIVKTGAGNSGNLYINGVLQASYSGSIGSTPNSNSRILLGRYSNTNYMYKGMVDEFAIYNDILTQPQIAAHYYAGLKRLTCASQSALSNGAWHHLAGIFDSTGPTLKLFVNGALNCTQTLAGAAYTGSMNSMVTGGDHASSNFWSGAIAAISQYSAALSASNVLSNFSAMAERFREASVGNIVTSGLVYHFDAANAKGGLAFPGSGCSATSASDLSTNGLTGTLTNFASCGATSGWNGVGSAANPYRLTLDGSNDYVSVPHNSALIPSSALTVSAWVRQSAANSNNTIAAKWAYSSQGTWAMQTGSGSNIRVYVADSVGDGGGNYGTTQGGWTASVWHHVAFVFDGAGASNAARLKIYIDGTLQVLDFSGTIPASLPASTSAIRIGDLENLSRFWLGDIADVSIYNTPLTQAEISRNCQALLNRFSGAVCN